MRQEKEERMIQDLVFVFFLCICKVSLVNWNLFFFNWKISKYYAVICFLLFAQWYVCNGLFLFFGKFTEKLLNTCLIATGLVGCLVLHWIQSSFSANSYKKACGHAHNEKEIRISKRRRYKISIISITCTFGLKL